MLLSVVASASAERVTVEPSAGARVTATDNAGLGLATSGSDLVLDVTAGLRVRAEGARLSLVGIAALESFAYARNTQSNDIVPTVDLTGRWVAIERFLFVEAAARTTQTHIDPFTPGLTQTSTQNNTTITQYRLTPNIESDPSANLHFRARSDNVRTKDYGQETVAVDGVDSSYFGFHTLSLERDPVPLGWRLEAQRSYTRYQGELIPLVNDIARALVNVAASDTVRVGLRAGAERNNYLLDQGWGPVYGGQASWRPSERTLLDFDVEHRFFGRAVHLTFTHRMPWLTWDLRARRDLDTTPSSLFTLPPTDNVAGLLDAMLATRIPNAAERATQVQNIISRQGLPAATAAPIPILAQRLSVTEAASLGVAYQGSRNTLAASLFATRIRDALEDGPLATDSPVTNNIQHGATLAYTLRLTPLASAGLTFEWSRIRSLDTATADQRSEEKGVRAQVVVQIAPKTSGVVGSLYRRLSSNVAFPGREASVFAAVDHRF